MPSSSSSLIRLSPLPFSSLPPHPALDREPSERPALQTFLHSALTEASSLISTTIPNTFTKHRKPCSSPPSTAKVHLSKRLIPADQLPEQPQPQPQPQPAGAGAGAGAKQKDEFWVCRQSTHIDDTSEVGTASWDEFEDGLRGAERHSRNEKAYTPSVSRVETVLKWEDVQDVDVQVDQDGDSRDGDPDGDEGGLLWWSEVEMCVNVITHTFRPNLLISPRTFIVLIISALLPPSSPSPPSSTTTTSQSRGFLTVQIPLSHTDPTLSSSLRDKIITSAPKNTVFASYASVERVLWLPPPQSQKPPDQNTETEDREKGKSRDLSARGRVEWTMATTSDAGGAVPEWVQRSWTMGGVPRAVVTDVGLFLGWVAQRRKR
ncbi:hypothetical protein VTN00DRAFT_5894 [Thermoascus crustaceus]|uniref:uncharacterized protein n=1 Tax=Thermoascus crustaceus TaxID=5088 RepID=UPI0037422AD5